MGTEDNCIQGSRLVDASFGEGGGQIFRVTLGLSAILHFPCEVTNIRSKRPQPGIAAQHVTVAQLIQQIAGGELSDLAVGSTTVRYQPTASSAQIETSDRTTYEKDVGTAGSVTLVLQALLPVVLFHPREFPMKLTLTGGTNVNFSPPIDHFIHVLLPLLRRMGIDVSVTGLRRGYFPIGGGCLSLDISRLQGSLRPLELLQQGLVVAVGGVVFGHSPGVTAAGMQELRSRLQDMMREFLSARPALLQAGSCGEVQWVDDCVEAGEGGDAGQGRGERAGDRKRRKRSGPYATLGGLLWLHTSTGCILSANAMVCGKDSERFSADVSSGLTRDIERRLSIVVDSRACVDEHTADQLAVFMALAAGESTLLCAPRDPHDSSLHVDSVLQILKEFTNCAFSIETVTDFSCRLIRCRGISLCPAGLLTHS